MLINTKPKGWHVEHPELAFKPKMHKPITIREAGKTRTIYVPSVVEQWVHHIIILILEPILRGSAYAHTYASFPKRGSHKGKKAISRWIHRGKGIRNHAVCDIRHFYDHVRYSIVRKKLQKRVHDNFFLHLIDVSMRQFLVLLITPDTWITLLLWMITKRDFTGLLKGLCHGLASTV